MGNKAQKEAKVAPFTTACSQREDTPEKLAGGTCSDGAALARRPPGATPAWGAQQPGEKTTVVSSSSGEGHTAGTPVEEIAPGSAAALSLSNVESGVGGSTCRRQTPSVAHPANGGGAGARSEAAAAADGDGEVRRQPGSTVPSEVGDDDDEVGACVDAGDVGGGGGGGDDAAAADDDDDGGIGQMADVVLPEQSRASPPVRDRLASASLSRRAATAEKDGRGRQFGGWETLGTLHKGPMSKVKLCRRKEAPGVQGPLRDTTEGDDVCAVKIFKKAKLARRMVHRLNALDAAFREVHVTMSLPVHRNFLRGVEVVETDEKLHLIMEHVVHAKPCCPLSSGMENVPVPAASRLTVEAACNYSRQLCEGLAFLHKIGLVHSDIKPANILVDEIENRVVIADFGSSFLMGTITGSFLTQNDPAGLCSELETGTAGGFAGGDADFDNAGVVHASPFHQLSKTAGTPAFLPPEACVEGGTSDGPERDMWAVGMLLYAMLYGKCLYWGSNANQFYEAIREHPATHVSQLRFCLFLWSGD